MGIKKRNYLGAGAEYNLSYTSMRGVDFSAEGENSHRYRFSRLENMYKDYDSDGAGIIESIPGFRKIFSTGEKIHAIHSHKNSSGKEYIVLHAGTHLYRFNVEEVEAGQVPLPYYIANDSESKSYRSGTDLYILDGQSIVRVGENGNFSAVGDLPNNTQPYIPTLFVNGSEYEQRNLLTNKFYEMRHVKDASEHSFGTEELIYRIISEENATCMVYGIDMNYEGEVRVPRKTTIGGKEYSVISIGSRAFFHNTKITSVVISEGITDIGNFAFIYCISLTSLVLPHTLKTIGNSAFAECRKLDTLYIGAGLSKIGLSAFLGCNELNDVDYALDEEKFNLIDGREALADCTLNFESFYTDVTVGIRIYSPATEITSVTVGGEEHEFGIVKKDGLIDKVVLHGALGTEFDDKEIVFFGLLSPTTFTKSTAGKNFIEEIGDKISGTAAIKGCKIAESFDGRIFLSGNPNLPNTVFYSSRDKTGKNNPLYFGELNYFNDGVGKFPVVSLLNAGDSLAVFKKESDGDGSIYYHVPKETGIGVLPKIYPVSYVHNGISAVGPSISFFDDALFLSPLGICALDKKAINLDRSIAIRSHNVNPRLLSENYEKIRFEKWRGYLAVLVEGRIYLADSRQTFTHPTGNVEYEWFYLCGIGTYSSDTRVYRYKSNVTESGYYTHEKADQKTDKTVYSYVMPSRTVYFTIEDGKRYEVRPTDEFTGGVFSPAVSIYSPDSERLFFGTESGDLCLFNNDKRGIAPLSLSSISGFDEKEYREKMGRRIHKSYYNFANHAPTYVMTTINDNVGIPHLTKNTTKHSLVIKLRSFGESLINVEVKTDRSGYREICEIPDASLNFDELDFSFFAFQVMEYFTIPIAEKEKRWIEKEITVYSNEFSSPIGIYSISYRFTVKGKIKKN